MSETVDEVRPGHGRRPGTLVVIEDRTSEGLVVDVEGSWTVKECTDGLVPDKVRRHGSGDDEEGPPREREGTVRLKENRKFLVEFIEEQKLLTVHPERRGHICST